MCSTNSHLAYPTYLLNLGDFFGISIPVPDKNFVLRDLSFFLPPNYKTGIIPIIAKMSSFKDVAVVICHGSYHTPGPYQPLVDALKAVGIDAYCPQLPTADLSKLNVGDVNNPDFDREPPPGGYPQGEEDTQVVLDVLNPLI